MYRAAASGAKHAVIEPLLRVVGVERLALGHVCLFGMGHSPVTGCLSSIARSWPMDAAASPFPLSFISQVASRRCAVGESVRIRRRRERQHEGKELFLGVGLDWLVCIGNVEVAPAESHPKGKGRWRGRTLALEKFIYLSSARSVRGRRMSGILDRSDTYRIVQPGRLGIDSDAWAGALEEREVVLLRVVRNCSYGARCQV